MKKLDDMELGAALDVIHETESEHSLNQPPIEM
jgi:hypothetical protein